MTKEIVTQNGKVTIERCGRCPAGNKDGLWTLVDSTRCGFTALVCDSGKLPASCPLEEYGAPVRIQVDKDAEIARLKDRIAQQDQELKDLGNEIPRLRRLAAVFIRNANPNASLHQIREVLDGDEGIPAYLDEMNRTGDMSAAIWKAFGFKKSGGPEQDSVYQRLDRLEGHLAQLYRHTGFIDHDLSLNVKCDPLTSRISVLENRVGALEKGASYVLKVKEDAPAEPEMVICPGAATCDQEDCNHKVPHRETLHCRSFCDYATCDNSRCVPVKK